MNEYPTELLVLPSPFIAIVSDSPSAERLTAALRATNAASTTGTYGATQVPAPRARYDRFTGVPAFARKVRSHAHEYETYTAPGILRSNWLEKRHQRCPALLVAAFDFDPRLGAAEWAAQEAAVLARLHELRAAYAKDRLVDVQVVLVRQGDAASTPRPDDRATQDTINERVGALRRKWPLDSNAVVVVPAADLAPSTPALTSLDGLLRERALAHYAAHTTRLKRSLARIGAAAAAAAGTPSAVAYAPLRVRLLFKVAHLQEFRGRPGKALKYFSQAYAALQAIPQHPVVLGELKAVAELLNFKIMHLYLMHAAVTTPAGVSGLTGAQAAAMQFQAHMRSYDGAVGDRSLVWQHWAWVGRQHVVAGELLALNLPRPTADTRPQHVPAHYFHSAALYAIRRRKAAVAAGLLWAAGGGGGSGSGVRPVGGAVTPAAAAAAAEAARSTLLPSAFIGARPRVVLAAAESAPAPGAADAGAALMAALHAHYRAQESRAAHDDAIAALLDRAQSAMPLDGGAGVGATALLALRRVDADGSAPAAARASPPPPPTAPPTLNADSSSRGRCWRSWLLAEELFAAGRPADAARLLLPVSEMLLRQRWAPLAARALLRLRECGAALHDDALLAAASLELLAPALHSNAVNGAALLADVARAAARLRAAGRPLVLRPPPPPAPVALVVLGGHAGSDSAAARGPPSRRRPAAQRTSTPLPAHVSPALTTAPSAPLLSAVVTFGRRAAVRGSQVAVRVIIASSLPCDIRLDRLELAFASTAGDTAQARNVTGAGVTGSAAAAAPSATAGTAAAKSAGGAPRSRAGSALEDFSPAPSSSAGHFNFNFGGGSHAAAASPFDLSLVDEDAAVGGDAAATTPATISAPDAHGVRRITFRDDAGAAAAAGGGGGDGASSSDSDDGDDGDGKAAAFAGVRSDDGPADGDPSSTGGGRSRFNSTGSLLPWGGGADGGHGGGGAAAAPVRCPLVLPAHGALAFEYVVRVPVTPGALSRSPRSNVGGGGGSGMLDAGFGAAVAAPRAARAASTAAPLPPPLRGRSNSLAARHADVESLLAAMAATPADDRGDPVCAALLLPGGGGSVEGAAALPPSATSGAGTGAAGSLVVVSGVATAATAGAAGGVGGSTSVDWTCTDPATMASVLAATMPPGVTLHSRVIDGETIVAATSAPPAGAGPAAGEAAGAAAVPPLEEARCETATCVSVRVWWSGRMSTAGIGSGGIGGTVADGHATAAGGGGSTGGIVFLLSPARLAGAGGAPAAAAALGAASLTAAAAAATALPLAAAALRSSPGTEGGDAAGIGAAALAWAARGPAAHAAPTPASPAGAAGAPGVPPCVAHVGRVGLLRSRNQTPGFVPDLGGEDDEDAEKRRKKAAAAAAVAAAAAAAEREARRARLADDLRTAGFLGDGVSAVSVAPAPVAAAAAPAAVVAAAPPARFGSDLLVTVAKSSARVRVECAAAALEAVSPAAGAASDARGRGTLVLSAGCFEPLRVTVHAGDAPLAGGVLVLAAHVAAEGAAVAASVSDADGDASPPLPALADVALLSLPSGDAVQLPPAALAQQQQHEGSRAPADAADATPSAGRAPSAAAAARRAPTAASRPPRLFVAPSTLVLRGDGAVTTAGAGGGDLVCIDAGAWRTRQPSADAAAGDGDDPLQRFAATALLRGPEAAAARAIVGVAVPPLPAGAEYSVVVFLRAPPLPLPIVAYGGGGGGGAVRAPRTRGALSAHLHCAVDARSAGARGGARGGGWVPRVLRRPHDYRQVVSHRALALQSPLAASLSVLPHATQLLVDDSALGGGGAAAAAAGTGACGAATARTSASLVLRLHSVATTPVTLRDVRVDAPPATGAGGGVRVRAPFVGNAVPFLAGGGDAAAADGAPLLSALTLLPGDAVALPLVADCGAAPGAWPTGRVAVAWSTGAAHAPHAFPAAIAALLGAAVDAPRLRLPPLAVRAPPISARLSAYPRPGGGGRLQPLTLTLRNGTAHVQLLEAEVALDAAGLPPGDVAAPVFFTLLSVPAGATASAVGGGSGGAPSAASAAVVLELLPGAEKTVTWGVASPAAAGPGVAALPIVRVRALEPGPAGPQQVLTLLSGATRAAAAETPPEAAAIAGARPLAPPLLLVGVSAAATPAVAGGECVTLSSSAATWDTWRFDPLPGAWTGELCTRRDGLLVVGTLDLRPTAAGCDDDPAPLVSPEARAAGPSFGPHELSVRLMGPEVASDRVAYLGNCAYRATFEVGTPGRYLLQVTLWRSSWGGLAEETGGWLPWQADHVFGNDTWVTLVGGGDASPAARPAECAADAASPGASPLACWDAVAAAASLPLCDAPTPPATTHPGRWVATAPAFAAPFAGRASHLRWSADWASGIAWRRTRCRDRPPADAPSLRAMLWDKRLLVVGDSQGRNLLNALIRQHSAEWRVDKGSAAIACFSMDGLFGPDGRWCFTNDNFADQLAVDDLPGWAAALAPGEPRRPVDVLLVAVGNHYFAADGGRAGLGRWRASAERIARELVARAAAHDDAVVLWMGNSVFPWRRDEWVRVTYGDTRTAPRLEALDDVAAAALRAALDAVAAACPTCRDRVAHVRTMHATRALADAAADDAHFTQPPAHAVNAQLVLEALRATSLGLRGAAPAGRASR